MATGATSRARSGQRRKGIEDVVGFAISNRTRVEILIVLRQGAYSASELSEIIGEPLPNVSHHLTELCDGGAIEIAETKKRRNCDQHYYRAIKMPEHSREDYIEMHRVERQVMIGLHVQSLLAEIMASLWEEKISEDPDHCFVWDRLNVDGQGRSEIAEEQDQHRRRLEQIEVESLLRSGESGEKTTPYIVAVLGFERGRTAPVAPG